MSEPFGPHFNRREFISTTVGMSGALLTSHANAQIPAATARGLTVHEITMATPDIVCVEIRDQPVIKGALVALPQPDPGGYDTWLSRIHPSTGRSERCMVVGPGKRSLRFQDIQPTAYLNRSAATNPNEYGRIGERAVTAVFIKSMQYSSGQGFGASGTRTVKYASMKHFLFLKLESPLMQGGPYTIRFPSGTGLAEAQFTFDDKTVRALAIRSTQAGHRPSDPSKLAYLALWIPGAPNDGAVNFARTYGLNSFTILDARGNDVFRGSISERVGPLTTEENASDRWRLASPSRPTIAITSASNTNPVVITAPGHGLANSDLIAICNMDGRLNAAQRGMTELNNRFFTVSGAAANTFALAGVDGTSFKPYQGGGGTVYRAYAPNRAATHVYGLDYSAWTPTEPGHYRVHVPGLGTSDPFDVDEEAWHRIAATSAKGEYHLRSGCALDGRFGYAHPPAFDSRAGLSIRQSDLPYVWTQLGGIVRGPVNVEAGATSPWVTERVVNTAYGGWFDAGDYVTRIAEAANGSYMLLDVYEHLPPAGRSTRFDIPLSSQVLDPSLYSAIDVMPDVVHQAVWNLDCYRRLQAPDGGVSGGMGMSSGAGTYVFEPSWLFRGQVYVYAPDHLSTFCYAGAAAKLAIVLRNAGALTLAMLWERSAVSAWNWAHEIYNDQAKREAHYATARSKSGWNEATYAANMTALQNACDFPATFAAGAIYRLNGDPRAQRVFEAAWGRSNDCYQLRGAGAWEYYHAEEGSRAFKNSIAIAISNYAVNFTAYSTGRVAYRNCSFRGLPIFFGTGGMDLQNAAPSLIRAHVLSNDSRQRSTILGTLQAGLAHIHGANQVGLCFTSGLGARNTTGALFSDALYGIAEGTIPTGITIYAWSQQMPISALNFEPGPLFHIVENPAPNTPVGGQLGVTYQSDFENERQLSYPRICFPQYEAIYENPLIIEQMEFTPQQTIIPQEVAALYLHAWDKRA
jgi:endoglucanase